MFAFLAGVIFVFAFLSVITVSLWVGCGKIFKIDNLTFKKAFLTYLLVFLVDLIFVIFDSLLPSSGIAGVVTDLFIVVANIIFIVWIVKKRFDTTMLRSIGVISVSTICLLGLALFVRTYVVQAYSIPAGSMKPTLLIGDHILVNKFTYDRAMPNRGDVIVFKSPVDPEKDFLKRVVGIPGDVVESRDKLIFVNDHALVENYAMQTDFHIYPKGLQGRDNFGPITVPENALFVMGDNRDHSFDSRFWGFVDMELVRGKAFMIYWSWDKDKLEARLDRIGSKIR